MSYLDNIEKDYLELKEIFDSLPEGKEKEDIQNELEDLYQEYCNLSFKFNCPIPDERL